ncbi:unnamed protein product [Lathyrus sativus]|nr:unnamed protein product [Lathyrus sativus]
MFLIQESKISNMEDFVAYSMWSKMDVDFSFSNSIGFSGGLITLWKSDKVEALNSFKGEGFLGTKVIWKGKIYYVVNVYSSCVLSKKKDLWSNLLSLMDSHKDGEWIIGGDFNAVKDRSERKGRQDGENTNEMELFGNFINDSGLIDVPCKGKKFTWYNSNRNSMSRIDRFLISNSIVNDWGVTGQLVGPRDISDHCPIWLVSDKENWGPKPFKFNNEWFAKDDFLAFTEREWKDIHVEGRGDFVLKEKLKIFKDRLKWWNREVFGKIDLEVEERVGDINAGDALAETVAPGGLSLED